MVSPQKQEKRMIIREAATRLFAEKGFENTTTRDIARAAKISNAALYYYFDNKEELLYQILEETMNSGLKKIMAIETSGQNLKEQLSSILKVHAATTVDYNKMKLLVHDQKSLSPEHEEALIGNQRTYVRILVEIFKELQKKGEMADLDPTACAFAFFGMVSWSYRWYDPKGKITPEHLSRIFEHIFTRGIFSGSL
jgi:AcrR family transcriptional regulator